MDCSCFITGEPMVVSLSSCLIVGGFDRSSRYESFLWWENGGLFSSGFDDGSD